MIIRSIGSRIVIVVLATLILVAGVSVVVVTGVRRCRGQAVEFGGVGSSGTHMTD